VPKRRAVSAGTGLVKNAQTCAPTPDRDTSSAAGTASDRRFQVRQRVQHRRWPIKVSGQPPAAVTVEQRKISGCSNAARWPLLSTWFQ
jgi:hypothetical protein